MLRLKHACVFRPGTASVIIALTDGELQEHQLITAQQEVETSYWGLISYTAAVFAPVAGLI